MTMDFLLRICLVLEVLHRGICLQVAEDEHHDGGLTAPSSALLLSNPAAPSGNSIPVTNVSGMLGRNAKLPCDITPPSRDHPLLIVIWFKEPSTDPVYSFDVRGNGVEIGRHWNDGINLGPYPVLWIEDLRDADRGLYRCRVDFKQAPTRISKVNLEVIVPPGGPVIRNERGIIVEDVLGPYIEGAELLLTCTVTGGRPSPNLYWLVNGTPVVDSNRLGALERERIPYSSSPGSSSSSGLQTEMVVSSSFNVGIVQRRDVDTTYTCLASNTNMTQASRAEVTLQMNLLPLHVQITSEQMALSADHVYDIHCVTPSALVTWWLGNTQLLDHSSQPLDGGNVTESTLRFQPKVSDLGKLLRCRAENPVMPASQIEDTWNLDINYLPRASLRFGSTLQPDNIKEGDDVYFECDVKAKPNIYKIEWKFNGQLLHQDIRGGIILGNRSLVLQSLDRNASGTYYCVATNSEGTAFSNPINLDIKFKPVCADYQKMVYGVAHGEVASINCSVKANPDTGLRFKWTFNSSAELNTLPQSRFRTRGTLSQLGYRLNTGRDYGTILCWAENALGVQAQPCVFHLIPAVPPAPPTDCNLLNLTSNSLHVLCRPGFDGGLPQKFAIALDGVDYRANASAASIMQARPSFEVHGLREDTVYSVAVRAINGKGYSESVQLKVRTLKGLVPAAIDLDAHALGHLETDGTYPHSAESASLGEHKEAVKPRASLPEKQGAPTGSNIQGSSSAPSPGNTSSGSSQPVSNMEPLLSIIGGVACSLVLMTLVIFLTLKLRCGGPAAAAGSASSRQGSSSPGTNFGGCGSESGRRGWKKESGSFSKRSGVKAMSSSDRDLLQSSPGPSSADLILDTSSSSSLLGHHSVLAASASASSIHGKSHKAFASFFGDSSVKRKDVGAGVLPPPPPPRSVPPVATLPRFHHSHLQQQLRQRQQQQPPPSLEAAQQQRSSSASFDALQLLQEGLPSPPEPPSFQVSALALDIPFTDFPAPPIDVDIVLPPPAECLYTLPRPGSSTMAGQRGSRKGSPRMDHKVSMTATAPHKKKGKAHTESVV